MNTIKFFVPGKPQGKARARTFYNPRLGRSISMTPDNTVLYENLIKECCMNNMSDEQKKHDDQAALTLYITALYAPVKSTSKKQRERMLRDEILPTKKPDIDNIVKVVADALNGVAYRDDTQIVKIIAEKHYSDIEGLEIRLEEYIARK